MSYTPHLETLESYARVMVQYALNAGKGLFPGETVLVNAQQCSEPLYSAIVKEIWKSGGNVISDYHPDAFDRYGINRPLLEIGTDAQLSFFPTAYYQGIVDSIDHIIFILADPNPRVLDGIPSERIEMLNQSIGPFLKMRAIKDEQSKLFWTICLYGTEAAAKEVGMSVEAYWQQIIQACYLDHEDPVLKWRETAQEIEMTKKRLDDLNIATLHITGDDVDLYVGIGPDRKWLGASGHNIPSFEIFTSPNWREVEGYIRFNEPLHYNGKVITDISLEFKEGVVVNHNASQNKDALTAMLYAEENANKMGEFSLTDHRHSRILRHMGHTLYDENKGGTHGNMHIALGRSFTDAYRGEHRPTSIEQWHARGFNQAKAVHTDIVSTIDRTVVATFTNGKKMTIYRDGMFII